MKNLFRIAFLECKFILRDKISLFFNFIFPFFLLFLFGSIWGKYPGYYGTLIPMLIVMTALSGGLFGIGIVLAHYRETGVFRRITLTPLASRTYIYGALFSRFIVAVSEAAVLLAIMVLILKQGIRGNLISLIVFLIVGTIAMLSLGALISSYAKTTEAAVAMSNIIFTPIMFLSGGFIPLNILPRFMQKLAQISPVYHFINPLQNIVVKGNGLGREWRSLVFLAVFFCLCVLFSRRRLFSE